MADSKVKEKDTAAAKPAVAKKATAEKPVAAKKAATTKPAAAKKPAQSAASSAPKKPTAAKKPITAKEPAAEKKPAAATKPAVEKKAEPVIAVSEPQPKPVAKKSTGSLKLTLTRSLAGRNDKHIATAKSLGLKKVGNTTLQPDNAQTRGKIAQISYMITVTEQ